MSAKLGLGRPLFETRCGVLVAGTCAPEATATAALAASNCSCAVCHCSVKESVSDAMGAEGVEGSVAPCSVKEELLLDARAEEEVVEGSSGPFMNDELRDAGAEVVVEVSGRCVKEELSDARAEEGVEGPGPCVKEEEQLRPVVVLAFLLVLLLLLRCCEWVAASHADPFCASSVLGECSLLIFYCMGVWCSEAMRLV